MDFQLQMNGPYQFPCAKLKPCPPPKKGSAGPVVIAVCGAFNPLHRAHLGIFEAASTALEARGRPVLGGYFSPVSDAYGKPGLLAAAKRVAVATAIVEDHPDLMIDTWEVRQPAYTRTVYVLEHLQESLNEYYHSTDVSVVLACGEDLYKSFFIPGVWPLDLLAKLLNRFEIVIIAREDVPGMHVKTDQPILTGRNSDGIEATLDLSSFHFIKTAFVTPDNTCSSEVRALVESSPDEATAVERIAPLVVNHKAAVLTCRYYGNFHGAQDA